MRLDRFLGEQGLGTRKEVKEMIRKGEIRVEGMARIAPETQIRPGEDAVFFRGEELTYKEFTYYMLHKPAGYVTAVSDARERTVTELLPEPFRGKLMPVGRLDKDTEGLLLLTNDGQLSHRLLSPKKHVEKVYEAHLSRDLDEAALEKLREGVDIGDDAPTLPAKAEMGAPDEEGRPVLYLTICEGRFHQVKRMAEAVGSEVLYLKRLSMGSLQLDEALAPGAGRELTPEEEAALKGEKPPKA